MHKYNHEYSFDPSYGYLLDELRQITAPKNKPDDFDEFWAKLYNQTLNIPLSLSRKPSELISDDWVIEEIYFNTINERRIGAWLLTPRHNEITALRIVGHGYGGREGPDLNSYELIEGMAQLFPVAPGFNISASDDIPLNNARLHVVHGIESKENYVLRECVASLWSAASVMLELFPNLANTLHYTGVSYGGGIGAMMLAWDERYTCAELSLPSFGHQPIRLKCECLGSGAAVTEYSLKHPEVVNNVLPYFDSAIHSSRIKQPVLWICASFDPVVPPPGQYAVANACNSEKIIFDQAVGHCGFDYPGKEEEVFARHRLENSFFEKYLCNSIG